MNTHTSLALAQDFPPISGGVSVYAANLFKNWSGKVIILAPEYDKSYSEEFPPNIAVKRIPMDLKRGGIWSFLKRQVCLYKASLRIIREEKINLIHCTHISSGLTALLLKKLHAMPYVLYTYGSEISGQHGIIRHNLAKLILKNALWLTTMSNFTRKAIMKFGIDKERIRFLVGVEIDRFSRVGDISATKKKYNINGGPIILTVARLMPHKGIDTVIKALPEILKKYPNLLYLVVGEGPYRETLEDLSKKLKVEDHIKLLGDIPHDKLQDETEAFYSICDLFVLISRNIDGIEAEGFGLVFLEAGLSKKAAVGGKSGGIQDAVIDGETGRLVNPDDPHEVARNVLFLLENRKAAELMGENGYKRAVKKFYWKTNVRKWEEELNGLFTSTLYQGFER